MCKKASICAGDMRTDYIFQVAYTFIRGSEDEGWFSLYIEYIILIIFFIKSVKYFTFFEEEPQ